MYFEQPLLHVWARPPKFQIPSDVLRSYALANDLHGISHHEIICCPTATNLTKTKIF